MLQLPAVLLMRPNHFVVLYWCDDRFAIVADPAIGWLRIPLWLFSGLSRGLAIVSAESKVAHL